MLFRFLYILGLQIFGFSKIERFGRMLFIVLFSCFKWLSFVTIILIHNWNLLTGRKDSSYQFNNGNTDTYQTPFNEKTDYNELLSSPFQSDNNNGRTGGQRPDQALGTGYSPFKADRGMPGMARMNNPGGNPLSQGGSQIGRGKCIYACDKNKIAYTVTTM